MDDDNKSIGSELEEAAGNGYDEEIMPEPDVYQIRLTGPGLSMERAVDGETAFQVLGLLLAPGATALGPGILTGGSGPAGVHSPRQPTRIAVGEYVRSTGAKRYPDKILSIGAWLEDHQGVHSFTRDEVKAQFRNLGEPPPQNLSRDFQTAVSYGWLSPDSNQPNAYWVTNTGREAMAAQFAGDTKSRTRRRPKKKAAEAPRGGNDEV
jgi:hypothetical protein